MSYFHAGWCLCWIPLPSERHIPPVFYYSLFQRAHLLQGKRHLLLQLEHTLSALFCKFVLSSRVRQDWYLLCWLKMLLNIVQFFGSTDLKQNMNLAYVLPFSPAASCFKRSSVSGNLGLSKSKWVVYNCLSIIWQVFLEDWLLLRCVYSHYYCVFSKVSESCPKFHWSKKRHLPRHLHLSKAITLHSYSYYVVDSGTS